MAGRERIYPGLVPFRDDAHDQAIFVGRDQARRTLTQLIFSEPFVLVYGRSGVGKTSLLQAGISKDLRSRGHFPVVVRPGTAAGPIGAHVVRAIRAEADRQSLASESVEQHAESLWEFLAWSVPRTASGEIRRPVLILDQFEELFTGIDAGTRAEFFIELADVVRHRVPERLEPYYREMVATLSRDDPRRAQAMRLLYGRSPLDAVVVVVIREDRFAELQRLQSSIPTIFATTYRVLPLDREAAREAIEQPPRIRGGFEYAPAAVDTMVEFLATRSGEDGASEGISPAVLQILCMYVEEQRDRKGLQRVGLKDLGGPRGMQRAVQTHYRNALRALPRFRAGWSARRWRPSEENLLLFHQPRVAAARLIEVGMITRGGHRTAVVEDVIRDDFGVTDRDMATLEERRLCVADRRLGRRWYELAHDRLVEPALRERARRRVTEQVGAALLLAFAALVVILLSAMTKSQWPDLVSALHAERDPVARAQLIAAARMGNRTVELQGTPLRGTDFRPLGSGKETITGVDWRGADLTGTRFDGLRLKKTWFDDAHLTTAHLRNAELTEVSFYGADLRHADLVRTTFIDSDLGRADLRNADISGASFRGCTLPFARFDGVKGLDSASFDGTAWWDAGGWSAAARQVLLKRWPPAKLARSAPHRKKLEELERDRRWTWSRYRRAVLSNDLAFRRAIHGRNPSAGLADADAAVRYISRRGLEEALDRWVRTPSAVRHTRADIFDTRGYIRLMHGDARGARSDFAECLRAWPRSPSCTYHAGLAAAATGDPGFGALIRRSQLLGYEPTWELLDSVARRYSP